MASFEIEIISDNEIKKLEKAKKILKEIKELDLGFKVNNIIEVDQQSTLVFVVDGLVPQEWVENEEKKLQDKLNLHCIILTNNLSLDKAIKKERVWIDTTKFNNIDVMKKYFNK